ncbi:MAG: hypothetical protein SFX18_10155 [Pirellulales bacterium]|nr:hypothetical protein [Pirellulales bacterium]
MQRFTATLLIGLAITPALVQAQQPADQLPIKPTISSGSSTVEVTPTPEMWFYDQERRRQENPVIQSQLRAMQIAEARQARLTALRWFGYSNSRPRAGTDPVHGSYAPRWVGNGEVPGEWRGVNAAGQPNIGGLWLYDLPRRHY